MGGAEGHPGATVPSAPARAAAAAALSTPPPRGAPYFSGTSSQLPPVTETVAPYGFQSR